MNMVHGRSCIVPCSELDYVHRHVVRRSSPCEESNIFDMRACVHGLGGRGSGSGQIASKSLRITLNRDIGMSFPVIG